MSLAATLACCKQFAHGEEAVELAGKVLVGDGHAGFLEAVGVFVAFVAQGIGAGGQHVGRRQADQLVARAGEARQSLMSAAPLR